MIRIVGQDKKSVGIYVAVCREGMGLNSHCVWGHTPGGSMILLGQYQSSKVAQLVLEEVIAGALRQLKTYWMPSFEYAPGETDPPNA